MRLKKILIVTPNLSTGGTNSSLSSVYDALKGEYEIGVFAMSHHGNANISFKQVLLPEYKLLSLWNCVFAELESPADKVKAYFLKAIRRLSRKCNYDLDTIVYNLALKKLCVEKYDKLISFQEGAATKFVSLAKANCKYAWVHCNYSNWHPSISYEEHVIYSKFDKIVCVSKYTSLVFSSLFKLSDRVITINNIQDFSKIRELAKDKIQDDLWNQDTYNIISVGRINPVKHFREIPDIAKKLHDNGCKFRWYIIGPEFDHNEMQTIKNGIVKHKLNDVVIYLGAKINPYPYFANADLYVCLSESEACPMVFNEAKTFGTPVVTTDFGSSYEFITSKEDGIISSRHKLSVVIQDYIKGGRTPHKESKVIQENNIIIKQQLCRLLNE